MTIEEQLAESQKWVKYYRKDRDTAEAQVDRLEVINAELLEALRDLVEINRRDDTGDPELTATDRWRHEAWSNAYDIIAKAEGLV